MHAAGRASALDHTHMIRLFILLMIELSNILWKIWDRSARSKSVRSGVGRLIQPHPPAVAGLALGPRCVQECAAHRGGERQKKRRVHRQVGLRRSTRPAVGRDGASPCARAHALLPPRRRLRCVVPLPRRQWLCCAARRHGQTRQRCSEPRPIRSWARRRGCRPRGACAVRVSRKVSR